jgi:serine protease Do
MLGKKAGLICVVLAALAIVGYGQTSGRQRSHSANVQTSSASGYLGVGVQDLPGNSGVEVETVTEGTPAQKAGIRLKDVILEFDGQKIESGDQFTAAIVSKLPGTKVSLTVSRNGVKLPNIVATLGVRPGDLPLNGTPVGIMIPGIPLGQMSPEDLQAMFAAEAPRVGFEGESLTPQLAGFFGVHEGVLVRSVTERTPADKAGLKAGDVVTKVNGMPVASPREISGIVRQAKKVVVFTVVRNKKEVTLNVEIACSPMDLPGRDAFYC